MCNILFIKTGINYTLVKQFAEQESATEQLKATVIVNTKLIYTI